MPLGDYKFPDSIERCRWFSKGEPVGDNLKLEDLAVFPSRFEGRIFILAKVLKISGKGRLLVHLYGPGPDKMASCLPAWRVHKSADIIYSTDQPENSVPYLSSNRAQNFIFTTFEVCATGVVLDAENRLSKGLLLYIEGCPFFQDVDGKAEKK